MTIGNPIVFDAVLAVMLVVIAWGALLVRDGFQAIVLFIVFGLLLAIGWCRLNAIDIALAEAAIGAGLTGAFLVNALASRWHSRQPRTESAETVMSPMNIAAFISFTLAVSAGLAVVIVPLASMQDAPRPPVYPVSELAGVTNLTTAVLLGFRAYDTVLEVAVLLAAVLAVFPALVAAPATQGTSSGPVLVAFMRLMLPFAAVLGAYLLWIGTTAAGGAFQAAAVLAAGGILLLVSGTRQPTFDLRRQRLPLVLGLAVFLLVASAGWLAGGRFLEYPPGWAKWLMLLIESALTVSITLILITLFAATSGRQT